ncbi:MAG TPA: ankyrin repeat domain-containing protein [Gemmatimonadales bacterium]|jgi:ankyrin repeat protein|nr:ankyrin repeat domain-containing protein [Gemmatimonadales bacterium]
MSRILPPRPNLEHLKAQAKALLRSLEEKSSDALERYRAIAPAALSSAPKLADAQFVIAREYGFESWPRLKSHVVSVARDVDPVQALVSAVKSGDQAEVAQLLADYPELKGRLDDALPGLHFDGTVLLEAVSQGNRDLIQLLLDAGADINQKSHWWAGGFGVLDSAPAELVPFLRERGAVLGANAAARLGMLDELKALVAADRSAVRARGGDGQTPLHVAANVAIAEYLLANGAELDAVDVDHESTPAQYLVREHQDIVRLLVSRGCRTDLLMAAALGDLELARRHLDADPASVRMSVSEASFPKRNFHSGGTIYTWTLGSNKTPHAVAREFKHQDVFQLLMDRTPDDLKLALACELGDEVLFRRLLTARPDLVQSLGPAELRKLPDAARNQNRDAVRLMLAAGWPPDVRGDHGGTALHWAAWLGDTPMVQEILLTKLNVNIKGDAHDMTPLGWAIHGSVHGWNCRTGDFAGAVRALLDAGASVPRLPPDYEMSEALREVLSQRGPL